MAKSSRKLGREEIISTNIFASRQERSDNGHFDVKKRLEDLIENSEFTGYSPSISNPSDMIMSEIENGLRFKGYDSKTSEMISGRVEVAPDQTYLFGKEYRMEANISERVLRLGSKIAIKLHPYDKRKILMGSYANSLSFLGILEPSQSLNILQSISDIVTLSVPPSFDKKGMETAKELRGMLREISEYSRLSMDDQSRISGQFTNDAERKSYQQIASIGHYRALKKIILGIAQKLSLPIENQEWFSEEMRDVKKTPKTLDFDGLMRASRIGEQNFDAGLSWMEKEYGMRVLGLNYTGDSTKHLSTKTRSVPSKLTLHYADNKGVHTHVMRVETEGMGIPAKIHEFLKGMFDYLHEKKEIGPFSNYASMSSHSGMQIVKHS